MIVFTITLPNGDVETLKTSRTKLTVGGAYTDDITLLNQDISPEHGVFHITGEEVIYTDNGYGTLVNNRKIVGVSIPVSPDDRVVIGTDAITYTLEREEIHPVRHIPSFKSDVIKVTRSSYSKTLTSASGTDPSGSFSPSKTVPNGIPDITDETLSQTSSPPRKAPYQALPDFKMIRPPEEPSIWVKIMKGLIVMIILLSIRFCI